MTQTSDRGKTSLLRNHVFLACLAVLLSAVCVAAVVLVSYSSNSRKLKDIRNQYNEIRAEYNVIKEKNDPSDKNRKELSNSQIKRNLAGISEDEEQEIRQNKLYLDRDIANRKKQIEDMLYELQSPSEPDTLSNE